MRAAIELAIDLAVKKRKRELEKREHRQADERRAG